MILERESNKNRSVRSQIVLIWIGRLTGEAKTGPLEVLFSDVENIGNGNNSSIYQLLRANSKRGKCFLCVVFFGRARELDGASTQRKVFNQSGLG